MYYILDSNKKKYVLKLSFISEELPILKPVVPKKENDKAIKIEDNKVIKTEDFKGIEIEINKRIKTEDFKTIETEDNKIVKTKGIDSIIMKDNKAIKTECSIVIKTEVD